MKHCLRPPKQWIGSGIIYQSCINLYYSYTTSASGDEPRRMLKIIRFGKHCSCHLQGAADAMFAESLDNFQHSMRLYPKAEVVH
jgi:hypothetical protein